MIAENASNDSESGKLDFKFHAVNARSADGLNLSKFR